MSTETPAPRAFCIRDLPFPAKLVITCFLLAVGGGYTAAMVQLHFQDSKSGEMMPTMHDVVLKFTGKKWFKDNPPKPRSKFEKLVLAPEEGLPFNGSGTMSPAFFNKDGGAFSQSSRSGDAQRNKLRAEREGEQAVLALWASAPDDVRERTYRDDHFAVPAADMPAALTPEFKNGDAIKVKSIIDARCVRCHGKEGAQANFPLQTYQDISNHLKVPETITVPPEGGWVKVEEPISLEKLTQSTHAHLLSFAMLFALTGLVVAFTSYPAVVRCVLGPWVLLAVVADVAMWWLARLCPEWGPYFSMAVIGTGGAAGAGLAAQITLSLWNMYGLKGRAVLVLLAVGLALAGGAVYLNKIGPGLEEKIKKLSSAKPDNEKKPEGPRNEPEKKIEISAIAPSAMEKVLQLPARDDKGLEIELLKIPFKGNQPGGMVRAFFDKDSAEFAQAVKAKEDLAELSRERHAELDAFRAWTRLADGERKKSYDSDAFELPATLQGKPVTPAYVAGGKLKIKTVIADRCVRCHTDGADAEKYPFDKYEQIQKVLAAGK